MIIRRSWLTPSGITATKWRPSCADASAIAMLVEPLDASTTVPPGRISPRRRCLAQDVGRDPVLGRPAGIEELELAPDRRAGRRPAAPEPAASARSDRGID